MLCSEQVPPDHRSQIKGPTAPRHTTYSQASYLNPNQLRSDEQKLNKRIKDRALDGGLFTAGQVDTSSGSNPNHAAKYHPDTG